MVNVSVKQISAIFVLFFHFFSLAYRPVVIIHGIFDRAADLADLKGFIEQAHPGTNVTLLEFYPEVESIFVNLVKQREYVKQLLQPIMKEATDGLHIIGFSQGGLLARSVIEQMPEHNVHTLVSLSSPQNGQFGDTSYITPYFPIKRDELYRVFYKKITQETFTIANYWLDPNETALYLKYSIFLPVVNNNNASSFLKPQEYAMQRENFIKLKKLILIGGPDDGVITPWQSSHFAAYDTKENVVDMYNQEIYLNDTFGLRTLDKRGDIHTYKFSNITHENWHKVKHVFTEAIEPWLD